MVFTTIITLLASKLAVYEVKIPDPQDLRKLILTQKIIIMTHMLVFLILTHKWVGTAEPVHATTLENTHLSCREYMTPSLRSY